ncbi:MAG: hypothetical protein LCH89_05860 [Proteobacteria bacterium]|nr:hypothetical protein [Pseudomonadota bacterium]
MTAKLIKVVAWIGSVALVAIAFSIGSRIPFSEQWPLYEALRTTAAIIFAVVGAWLAIVYPDRLRLSLGNGDRNSPAGQRFSSLFTPIANSTVILCLVLIIGVLVPIVRQIPALMSHIGLLRAFSFSVLTGLTLWQVWTVVLTLIPADQLKSQADREVTHVNTMNGLRGLGSAEKPRKNADQE